MQDVRERALGRLFPRLWWVEPREALEGQERGELRGDVSVSEMVRVYTMCERALIYEWCLSGGGYSLMQSACGMMPMFFQGFRVDPFL